MNNHSVDIVYLIIVITSVLIQPIVDIFFTRKKYYWSGIFIAHTFLVISWLPFYILLRLLLANDSSGEGLFYSIMFLGGFSLFTLTIYGICSLGINLIFLKDVRSLRSNSFLRYRPWVVFSIILLFTIILIILNQYDYNAYIFNIQRSFEMLALFFADGAVPLLLILLGVISVRTFKNDRKKVEDHILIQDLPEASITPIQRIHRLTAFILVLAIVFYLFFQVNKRNPFVMGNSFAVDPYDAVGSIAIQLALLVSLLNYARVLRQRDDPAQDKVRLVLHGNILVLAAIFITLCSDTVAEFVRRLPPSIWVIVLRLELGGMFLLTLIGGLALWIVFKGMPTTSPPPDLTPADAIDDLWCLVRLPVIRAGAILPPPVVDWVNHFNSDRLFNHFQWLDPRRHPWRFTAAVGVLIGLALWLAGFQEGLPPSLGIGLLLLGIDISVELVAALLGYGILGGYLGLRPRIQFPTKNSYD